VNARQSKQGGAIGIKKVSKKTENSSYQSVRRKEDKRKANAGRDARNDSFNVQRQLG